MIHFDVYLAYWQLESDKWSLDKLWLFHGIEWTCAQHWFWWKTAFGDIAFNNTIKSLPENIYDILLENDALNRTCEWSDLFYVPKKHAEMFIYLSELASQNKLFFEIAVPACIKWTAVLASPNNFESEIVTESGNGIVRNLARCAPNALFCHKVDLQKESEEVIRRFTQPVAWHWN